MDECKFEVEYGVNDGGMYDSYFMLRLFSTCFMSCIKNRNWLKLTDAVFNFQ